jgi:hypothetical protein
LLLLLLLLLLLPLQKGHLLWQLSGRPSAGAKF